MYEVEERHLRNGLTLLACRMDNLHSIQINVYLKGGCLYETEETNGVGHLVEHLMFRNMNGLDRNSLYRVLDGAGARMRGHIYRDCVTFNMKVSPNHFDEGMGIICRLLGPGTFRPEDVEKEKEVVCRQVESTEDTFIDDAQRRYWRTPAGAFKLRGTTVSIENMNCEQVQQEKEKMFAYNNVLVVMTGSFTPDMLDSLARRLDAFPAGLRSEPVQLMPEGFLSRDEESTILLEEKRDRATVQLSFDIDDTILYDTWVQILSSILGNGSCSALLSCLRDEKGFTSDIYTDIEQIGAYRRLTINYHVGQKDLNESLSTLFTLLARARQYIGENMLRRVRVFFGDNLHFMFDHANGVNKYLARSWLNDSVDQRDFDTLDQMYRDTTTENIQDTAQTLLRSENMWVQVRYDPDKVSRSSLMETVSAGREMLR